MSDHVLFNSPAYGAEVAGMVGTELPPKSSSICRVRNGTLLGGAVYFNKFGTTSISAHIAGKDPHWLNRDLLFMLFDYPFNQLKVERIFGFVAEDNQHAIRFNLKLGFTFVTHIPHMYKNDTACLVMQMEREYCRFLLLRQMYTKLRRH